MEMEERMRFMQKVREEMGDYGRKALEYYEDVTMYNVQELCDLFNVEWAIRECFDDDKRKEMVAKYIEMHGKIKKIPNAPERIYLWPEGKMPAMTEYTDNSEGKYFHNPDFQPYMLEVPVAEGVKPVGVVITVAGGQQGPNTLNECYQINKEFADLGYLGFILHCRPNACPWNPRETGADVARAIRIIRANAEKFNIDPNRIAVAGFSNGGVAGEACIQFYSGEQTVKDHFPEYEPDELDSISGAPNVYLCVYGARHKGTEFDYSKVVYPPTFFAIGLEDKGCIKNLNALLPDLFEREVRVEIHTFAAQPHGYAGWRILDGKGNPNFDLWVGHADVFMRDTYENYQ